MKGKIALKKKKFYITAILAIFAVLIGGIYINQNIQISKLNDGKENLDSQTVKAGNINSLPIEGKTIINKASELLGAPYTFGGKGGLHAYDKDQYNTYDAATVRRNGLDCSGLVWWTLTSLKFSTSGFSFQNPVPVDANHWYYTDYYQTQKFSSNSNAYITYGGQTVKVEALAINKTSGYYYDMVSGNIPMGTVFSSAPYGNSQNGHMWIYIGNLGTSNKEEAIKKLKELGININDSNRDYVESNSNSTHWIIESYGDVGVRITNNNYKYGDTVSEGKVIGATWAFQIAPENPKGSYHLNIVKKDYADSKDTATGENKYSEAIGGAEFKIAQDIESNKNNTIDGYGFTDKNNGDNSIAISKGKALARLKFTNNGSDNSGNISIKSYGDNEYDYYTIKETKAPDNYYIDKNWTIGLRVYKGVYEENGTKKLGISKIMFKGYNTQADGTEVSIDTSKSSTWLRIDQNGKVTQDTTNYKVAFEFNRNALTITWKDPKETKRPKIKVVKQDMNGNLIPDNIASTGSVEVYVGSNKRTIAFNEVEDLGTLQSGDSEMIAIREKQAPNGYINKIKDIFLCGNVTFRDGKLELDGKGYISEGKLNNLGQIVLQPNKLYSQYYTKIDLDR